MAPTSLRTGLDTFETTAWSAFGLPAFGLESCASTRKYGTAARRRRASCGRHLTRGLRPAILVAPRAPHVFQAGQGKWHCSAPTLSMATVVGLQAQWLVFGTSCMRLVHGLAGREGGGCAPRMMRCDLFCTLMCIQGLRFCLSGWERRQRHRQLVRSRVWSNHRLSSSEAKPDAAASPAAQLQDGRVGTDSSSSSC